MTPAPTPARVGSSRQGDRSFVQRQQLRSNRDQRIFHPSSAGDLGHRGGGGWRAFSRRCPTGPPFNRRLMGRLGRFGVFGGTFDPPHIGHLAVAVEVRWALDLDRVLLVVANDPWQKRGTRRLTPARDRYEMVRAAVEGLDGVEADDREIRRGGPSFTVDTVRELLDEHPGAEVFVVVGGDAALGLGTWERADELAELATVVVVHRPGYGVPGPPEGFRWRTVEVPALDVSSSDLRSRMAEGRPVDVLVPEPAATWARGHDLYPRGA